jgi:RHS repeat-associated protein
MSNPELRRPDSQVTETRSINSATATYTYNADGVRNSRTVGSNTTNYTWTWGTGLPVVLKDDALNYVYGLGLILSTNGTAVQNYFMYDGLGSVTDVRDASGNAVDSYKYDAFGAIESQSGTSSNYWGFAGEQRDDESDFYYLRDRYFDPVIGRFLGQDRLGGGYPYAGNNPINLTDPTGLYMIACDDGDESTACIDSVDVGLPAEPPSSCDTGANNVCVWDSGFTAPYESNRPSCLDSGCTATTKNAPVRSKESPDVDDEDGARSSGSGGGGGGGGSWGSDSQGAGCYTCLRSLDQFGQAIQEVVLERAVPCAVGVAGTTVIAGRIVGLAREAPYIRRILTKSLSLGLGMNVDLTIEACRPDKD